MIKPLRDPLTNEFLNVIVESMDIMAENFKVLLDLTKKIKILGSHFLSKLQPEFYVSPGKEEPSHSLKYSGPFTSAVSRNLQTLSSPDFQSNTPAAMSTILMKKVSSSSGVLIS